MDTNEAIRRLSQVKQRLLSEVERVSGMIGNLEGDGLTLSPPDMAGSTEDSRSAAVPCAFPTPCDCPVCICLGREVPRVQQEASSRESTAPPTHESSPSGRPTTPTFRAEPEYECVPKPHSHHGPEKGDLLGNRWYQRCDAFLGNDKIHAPAAAPDT